MTTTSSSGARVPLLARHGDCFGNPRAGLCAVAPRTPMRGAASLAAVVLALCSSAGAGAQTAADLNRQAGIHYKRGEYAAAAKLLRAALKLEKSPKVHRNLALCYFKLKRLEWAAFHLKSYLFSRPDAPDRPWVERTLAQIDARLHRGASLVRVLTSPRDALVFLGSQAKPLGRTPLQVPLPPGSHRLRFELAEHKPFTRTIEVVPGRNLDVSESLEPLVRKGTLHVRSELEDLQVTIDGSQAKLGDNLLVPGTHRVVISKAGRRPWRTEATVEPGGRTQILVTADRLKPIEPPKPPRPYRTVERWKWAALGIGVAAIAGTTLLYGRALSDQAKANALSPNAFPDRLEYDMAFGRVSRASRTYASLSTATFVTAFAACGATLAFFIYDWRQQRTEAPRGSGPTGGVNISPTPGGGVAMGWLSF